MEIATAEKVMRIGELSRRSKISKQLIHYYLRRGYLHPPVFKKSNQAYYDQTHLERLLFLRKCNEEAIPLSHAAATWEKVTAKKKKSGTKRKLKDNVESKTRDSIIREASQIFLRKGYSSPSIAEIMEKVGVTKPSFYYYFRNKKDLYLTCLDCIFDSFSKSSLDSIRQETKPLKRLEQRWKAGHTYSKRLSTSINLLKDSLRQEDPEERARAESILRKSWVDPLTKDLERGIKSGDIRPVRSEIISFALISLLDTFIYREILENKYGSDAVLESVYDLILHGLLPKN
ncbi:MAG: TetR family transcriptional regulator [Bacillota bacterium]|nr:TetR family transcriptional regulator [Bacillota bacterium]